MGEHCTPTPTSHYHGIFLALCLLMLTIIKIYWKYVESTDNYITIWSYHMLHMNFCCSASCRSINISTGNPPILIPDGHRILSTTFWKDISRISKLPIVRDGTMGTLSDIMTSFHQAIKISTYTNKQAYQVQWWAIKSIMFFLPIFPIIHRTSQDFYARQHICYSAYMLWQFRLSICPSHGWISQKRLKLGSCNFHHTVAPSL